MNALARETLRQSIQDKWERLRSYLDERARRLWAATEARAIGYGGIQRVHQATGIAHKTIRTALRELVGSEQEVAVRKTSLRLRKPGGGRKKLTTLYPNLLSDLECLIDPDTRGDPQSALRWSSKSLQKLKAALQMKGYSLSHQSVGVLLGQLGYSLQANQKVKEGSDHPDRDTQFAYINERTKSLQQAGQPVISVDCKKKEILGDFKNGGHEWNPAGHPDAVRVHDFMDKELGKAICESAFGALSRPYGVYDVCKNRGFVNVGIDHDTAAFAVASIERWWEDVGKRMYPDAKELQIMADGGGSNASRSRLWKICLQGLSDRTGLSIHVCHFPPGTSKWNKIEHRMFSYITLNWRGRPLTSLAVIISLIGSTTTQTGLCIDAALDTKAYPTRIVVSETQLSEVNLERHTFHGEWNYTIRPKKRELIS